MKFNFFKRKKAIKRKISAKETLSPIRYELNVAKGSPPQIYRGVAPYETESDRFGIFDEDYFCGENYEKKKRRTIPPPKTQPIFYLKILLCSTAALLVCGIIIFFSLFSRFGGGYEQIRIPDFTNLSEEDAISRLKENQYFNYTVEYRENPTVSYGTVVAQSPAPNTERKLYRSDKIKITLTVSKKADPITLPNLLGQDARQVALELKNAGVNVTVKEAFSSTVKSGKIISSSLPKGSKLYKNDSIVITKSLGEPISYITVPTLLGLSESEAMSILGKGDFTISDIIYKNSHYPKGLVIEQSISEGLTVRKGEKISLTISIGKAAINK